MTAENSNSPDITPENDEEKKAATLLQDAFKVFSEASRQLEVSYDELKEKADKLALELAQTNDELQRQLTEKERISNFLSNILQSTQSGIIVISQQGDVIQTNHRARELLHMKEIPEGQNYKKVLPQESLIPFLSKAISNEDHTPHSKDIAFSAEEDKAHYHFNLGFSPVLNRQGDEVAYLLMIQDVTRLKLLEEQSLRTSRLSAMGEMAAELAHEIRNPLGSIEIFASLLSRDLKNGDNKKLADNIVIGVKSLNSVVTNMLTFTRDISVKPETLDFNELVSETLGFLEQMLAVQDIALDQQLAPAPVIIHVDAELVKQVLLNLLQNAIHAMELTTDPLLTVSVNTIHFEDGRPAVEVIVQDNGCGIPMDDLPKIFDPFFSTRQGGTGLGLSVVSQIIGKHGGLITAESEPGSGTKVRFSLPQSQQEN
jgi:PAS domain S-box-containing protein